MCISNGCFHLTFANSGIGGCTIGDTFYFFTARIDTISFIKNNTTNSHFIERYILSGTNCNGTTCICNSDVIAIDEVDTFTTSYSSCTTAICFYIPRSSRFSKVLDVGITGSRQVRQILISRFFCRCHSRCQFCGWRNRYIIAGSRCSDQRISTCITFDVERNATSCAQFLSCCRARFTS